MQVSIRRKVFAALAALAGCGPGNDTVAFDAGIDVVDPNC